MTCKLYYDHLSWVVCGSHYHKVYPRPLVLIFSPSVTPSTTRSVQWDVSIYLSLDSKWEQAGLKKDLRVSRVGPGGSLNALFFLPIGVHKDFPW
ncbi:hypothetical protein KSP39_PZI010639 [Platanthera zijinensis]|uniref:Uncharacterized protein n=1 Tax=Platanthera zijinensis TaxID=2320716 RepID=A0AAP0BJQ9_9ASPA